MKKIFYILIIIVFSQCIWAQENINILEGKKINNDTLPHIRLDEVYIFPNLRRNTWWNKWKYQRLIRNIKAVYPYAKYAHQKFNEMDEHYKSLETEKEKRKYIKRVEDELLDEFEDDLKKLTISQGRLLIKLIDRETNHTSYEILKEYKGSLSAFFWQALAKIFGSNLKVEYDPLGKDRIIEELIFLYEMNLL